MLFQDQSAAAVEALRNGRADSDSAMFRHLMEAATNWRPHGYDLSQSEMRDQYEGKIAADLQKALAKRFPLTHHKMQMTPLNWCRLYAENASAVYDWPSTSYLERKEKDGTTSLLATSTNPADRQAVSDFADMIAAAELDPFLAETERRTEVAGTMFLRVLSDSVEAAATGQPPITRVQSFWPSDVWVIPHPQAPANDRAAVGYFLRVAGAGGVSVDSTHYELWTRTALEDQNGQPSRFGPWTVQRVTVKREAGGHDAVRFTDIVWTLPGGGTSPVYPLPTCPIIAWHDGQPDGIPYVDNRRNLIDLFRASNVALVAEQFAADMSSATPLIRKTNATQPKTIALGPGIMPAIPLEDDVIPIAMSADFEGMRSVSKAVLGALALTTRQSVGGYDVDKSGQAQSGVALKIQNEPQTKARQEAIARASVVHERMLAVMIEVNDFFRGTAIGATGAKGRVRVAQQPDHEDREAAARRLVALRDAGILSSVEVRLGVGASDTEDEAKAAIEAITAERAARAPGRMAALMGSDEPETETEDDTEDKPAPAEG